MRNGMPAYMQRAVVVSVTVFCAFWHVGDAAAQSLLDPIILAIQGDLWSWEGTDQVPTQITQSGYIESPVVSPDGTRIAFSAAPSTYADWVHSVGGAGGFTPPQDVSILDLTSGQIDVVADQGADAVWDGPTRPGKYILRSTPAWSPDGLHLVWMAHKIDTLSATSDEENGLAELVIYDLMTKSHRVLDSFPLSRQFTGLIDVQWGRLSIAVKIGLRSYTSARQLRFYDLSGDLLSHTVFERDNLEDYFSAVWMQDVNEDYLYDLGSGNRLNWQTGQTETFIGNPELYSVSSPNGASILFSESGWQLLLQGQVVSNLGTNVHNLGVSRDGQSVVYSRIERNPATGNRDHTVIVLLQGQTIEIGRYQNARIVWGPIGWRVHR